MKTALLIAQKLLLVLAGGLLILIAGLIHLSPGDFYAANGINPAASISLLNELKAPAGFLLLAGAVMIVAAFHKALQDAATLLAAMVYLSYALSRVASVAMDGLPAEGLMQAAALEALIGIACLLVLGLRRHSAQQQAGLVTG